MNKCARGIISIDVHMIEVEIRHVSQVSNLNFVK